ncbi:YgjV family protein [Fertoebacter nigrum]|uniref:YgjV family protein n=1 Tax=Fertoeibacter niger TaxID=2656921 RepID=A0A8X8KPL3_9RHOB|nr:YgjV family protein [Fertoeibacter niger]NUB46205.1 YgjV family protein [Fertoeibacter niger]
MALETVATGLGLLAAGMLVASALITSPRRMLQVQTGVGLAFGAHFLMLGLVPAAAMNGLAAVQAAAAILALRRPAASVVGYGIIPMLWVAGTVAWSGPLTLLAVAAMTVVALARMMSSEMPMRFAFLAGSALWFTHDVLAMAWIPLCADVLCFVIGLGFILHRKGVVPARFAAGFSQRLREWRNALTAEPRAAA